MTVEIAFLKFGEVGLSVIKNLADKVVDFVDKFNILGVFDGVIDKTRQFSDAFEQNVIGSFQDLGAVANEQLQSIIDEGSATAKVGNIVETVKEAIADIRAEGEALKGEQTGIAPFNTENLELTQENMEANAEQDAEAAANKTQLSANLFGDLAAITATGGKKIQGITKLFSISQALTNSYLAFTNALANIPAPFNIPAAGAALAAGLAQVANIKGQAHDGLTNVPSTGSFVLEQGERVIKTKQNEDLTNFLENADGGSMGGQTNNITIFPNATNVDSMLSLSPAAWQEIAEDKIVPALTTLKKAGITI